MEADYDSGYEGETYGEEPVSAAPRGPAPLGRPATPYAAEHYYYLETLYSSDYKADLILRIRETHLSPAAKRAFIATIESFFAHTAFLSYQKDPEIAEIDLDIALNQLTLSCNVVDINLPEYPHLIELIRSHFNRFIATRATGPERERILQNRSTFEQVQKIAQDEEKKQGRRGLGILDALTGRGGT